MCYLFYGYMGAPNLRVSYEIQTWPNKKRNNNELIDLNHFLFISKIDAKHKI